MLGCQQLVKDFLLVGVPLPVPKFLLKELCKARQFAAKALAPASQAP